MAGNIKQKVKENVAFVKWMEKKKKKKKKRRD